MANRHIVPIVVAPDDDGARQQGEHAEALLRSAISTLWHGCKVAPQPRWLFQDIERGRPASASQLFRAVGILARHPEVAEADMATLCDRFTAAMIAAPRPTASLETLVAAETEAQAEADVLQMRAVLSRGGCPVTMERAAIATARHKYALSVLSQHFAAGELEARRVRRPTRLVASRS